MKTTKKLSRRDFMGVMGTLGLSAFVSRFIKTAPKESAGKKNVIIVVFDTLSANHMSLYGYGRNTTPHINKFAERSIVYHKNYAAASYTHSSAASIFTGVHTWSHRAVEFFTPVLGEFDNSNLLRNLHEQYQTITCTHNPHVENLLAQFRESISREVRIHDISKYDGNKVYRLLKNDTNLAFFATSKWGFPYFGSNSSLFFTPYLTFRKVIDQAVQDRKYRESYPAGISKIDEYYFTLEDAIDLILELIGAKDTAQPLFGYFHLFPPHEPYNPRADFYDRFANDGLEVIPKPEHFFTEGHTSENLRELTQRYDEYISHVDSEFGRLVDSLEASGALDDSYLILTADHGQLFERGVHGHLSPVLYEGVIHTPLLIRQPGQTERIDINTLTSSLDLAPTILQLTGADPLTYSEGRLLPGLGGVEDPERTVYSLYTRLAGKFAPLNKATFSAVQWPYKLIHYAGYDKYDNGDELYNLEDDPQEMNNLVENLPDIAEKLKKQILESKAKGEAAHLRS